jgi:hypothetical protein
MTRWMAVGALLLCVSCSHSSSQALSTNGARLLQAEVAAARLAAEQGDYVRSAAEIKTIETTVGSLQSQRLIASDRAAEVLRAAATVRSALTALTTTSTTTGPAATLPPPTPPPHEHGKGHGHGDQGNDNGD